MSDLEQRLTQALRHGGDDEPSAIGLVDRVRRRARARRRNRAATLAVAAVVVLAPTAAVVAHGAGGGADPGGAAASASASSSLATMTGPGRLRIVGGCPQHYVGGSAAQANFVAVCHYDADDRLTRSGTLDLVASVSARVAIQDAAVIDTSCPRPHGEFVVFASVRFWATVDLRRGCFTLAGSDEARTLTAELRHYAAAGTAPAG